MKSKFGKIKKYKFQKNDLKNGKLTSSTVLKSKKNPLTKIQKYF